MTEDKARDAVRPLVSNRKARHIYEVLETHEAGIALSGTEVKSLRAGEASLQDSYAVLKGRDLWLLNMHIAPYAQGNRANVDPLRTRRLLLHRHEIVRLAGKVAQRGLTLVPLSVYLKGRHVKVELGLARGRHSYDKKHVLKERDLKRDADRQARNR
jgi:SsrA-binding protein